MELIHDICHVWIGEPVYQHGPDVRVASAKVVQGAHGGERDDPRGIGGKSRGRILGGDLRARFFGFS